MRAPGVGTFRGTLTSRATLLAVAVVLLSASTANAADGPLPSSPAVDALLADGPYCGTERVSDAPDVTGDAPHVKVIYAYAAGVGDRFALFASAIQRYTKAAAAKLALSSDKTLRLDRGSSCGAAFLDIQTLALGHPASFYATDSNLVLADVASHLPDRRGVNYLVFVDLALPALGAAAATWAQDDSPWATNAANGIAHSRYAYLEGGAADDFFGSEQLATQYADQVLHEVLHTLGAVQPSAPHFSGGAHCYEIYDVMCYTPKDGTPDYLRNCGISSAMPNPGKPLDCGGDDYFNASPAPGSYLATHWNLYNSGFLCNVGRCHRAPVAPTAQLAVVAGDGQSVTVSAASSSDPDGVVVSYVWDINGDGVYDASGPAAQTVAVAGHAARELTVAAVDNDNLFGATTITVDEHSIPGQVGSADPGGDSAIGGGTPGTISEPSSVPAAALSSPKIAVAASRVASAARLQLTVARRTTLEQVRARGLQVTLSASRDLRVGVAVRRGTRVLARLAFAATRRAKHVTVRLTGRQLRELARRSATTLTVQVSAAGAASLRRQVVVRAP